MGTFKTLEAFFKPVPKSRDSSSAGIADASQPVPDDKECGSQPASQTLNATSQPPRPAPKTIAPPCTADPNAPAPQPPSAKVIPDDRTARTTALKKPLQGGAGTVVARSKSDILAEMLNGRKAVTSSAAAGPGRHDGPPASRDTPAAAAAAAAIAGASEAPAAPNRGPVSAARPVAPLAPTAVPPSGPPVVVSKGPDAPSVPRTNTIVITSAAAAAEAEERPRKRPYVPMTAAGAVAAARSAGTAPARARRSLTPLERRSNLTCLLQARSQGGLLAHRELWWYGRPGLVQVGCWSGAEGLRAASVVHQDAVAQIEVTPETDAARACLAVGQANQLVRIVPYRVLRDYAESRRAADREAAEASDGSDEDDGAGAATRQRRRHAAARLLPWADLADAGRVRYADGSGGGGGGVDRAGWWGNDGFGGAVAAARSSAVLSLNTRNHVACLGWDPRRRGRLALVDRSSPSITVLDLGWGQSSGGGGGGGTTRSGDFTRTVLSVGGTGGTGGGGAARAMAYVKYGSLAGPYTLAAAGRAGGEGAVVHLWDERRGSLPVSRLACPGGASLVTRMEPTLDGTALLGVVGSGTLVLWDVRRASSTAACSAVFSLGASVPAPSAVVGSWDLLSPLAAVGCRRPVISSLAPDPRDASRTAILTQDGTSAVWDFASSSITHASPAADRRTPVPGSGPIPLTAAVPALGAGTGIGHAGAGFAIVGQQPVTTAGPRVPASEGPGDSGEDRGLDLFAVCTLGGFKLFGGWDADVCGFWHPGAVMRPGPNGQQGGEVGAPALCLADCRSSAALQRMAPVAVAAPPAAPRAAGPVPAAAAAAAVPGTSAAAAAPPPPVSHELADWPVCVACLPDVGDLVVGTLRGQLSYLWKA